MKTTNTMKIWMVALALFLGFGSQAWADWTRSGNTITDANGWVLKVEAKTINGIVGLSLPTDAVTTKGTPTGVLNLSGTISDGTTIVQIDDSGLRLSSAGTLYSVTLPSTVIRIGGSAFSGQTSLTNVTPLLPPSVKLLGNRAFNGTKVGGALDLSSVTNIGSGDSDFRYTSVTSAVFNAQIATINGYFFESCKSLRSVQFPSALTTIGINAFSGCTNLYELSPALPATVASIGSISFSSVPYTGRVDILSPGYTKVETQFWTSGKVSAFVFGVGLTNVSDYAFDALGTGSRAWDINFRGGVPTFATAKSQVFRGTDDWKLRVFYPYYDQAWKAWVAANAVPLTSAQTNTYVTAYPAATVPTGRGNTGTIFANEYLVAWNPLGSAGALLVEGSPSKLGAVSPAYDMTTNIVAGTQIACSASATATNAGIIYTCAGYVLETLGTTGWENPVTNLASTSFTYTQSGTTQTRLTWLWSESKYLLSGLDATSVPVVLGSVSRSVQPDAGGYYPAGTVVSLTATAASGSPTPTFCVWSGDVPVGQDPASTTITLTMSAPKTVTPMFNRDWIFTSGSPSTISDGYWTLNVSGTTALTITGVAMSGVRDLINLSTPISNGGNVVNIAAGGIFQNNTTLTSVTLPNTVTNIGDSAFRNMSALTNIVLSANLVSLENCAFYGNSKLVSVTPFLPDTVTTVGPSVFYNCTALTGALRLCNPNAGVTIAGSGNGGFMNSKIANADLSSVTNIGANAIRGITTLTNVVLSSVLKAVGDNAFFGDSSLVSVTPLLPNSLVSLGKEAFQNCTSLTNDLVLGLGTTYVGLSSSGNQFSSTKIANATFGQHVTNVPSSLLSSGTRLQRVYFGGYPTFASQWLGSTVPTNYQVRCYIPRGNTSWASFAATGVVALTASETNRFLANFPGERLPIGTWITTGGQKQWYSTWVSPGSELLTTMILVR